MKYPKSYKALEIIADELHMPKDASLADILAHLYLTDVDGEVMKLLISVMNTELISAIKALD